MPSDTGSSHFPVGTPEYAAKYRRCSWIACCRLRRHQTMGAGVPAPGCLYPATRQCTRGKHYGKYQPAGNKIEGCGERHGAEQAAARPEPERERIEGKEFLDCRCGGLYPSLRLFALPPGETIVIHKSCRSARKR